MVIGLTILWFLTTFQVEVTFWKTNPFFENPWRLSPENTPFFWKSWAMPSTEKQPFSQWNYRRAWLPFLLLRAVPGHFSDGEIYSGVELTSWTFIIIASYMVFLHLNWCIAEWLLCLTHKWIKDHTLKVVTWVTQHWFQLCRRRVIQNWSLFKINTWLDRNAEISENCIPIQT